MLRIIKSLRESVHDKKCASQRCDSTPPITYGLKVVSHHSPPHRERETETKVIESLSSAAPHSFWPLEAWDYHDLLPIEK